MPTPNPTHRRRIAHRVAESADPGYQEALRQVQLAAEAGLLPATLDAPGIEAAAGIVLATSQDLAPSIFTFPGAARTLHVPVGPHRWLWDISATLEGAEGHLLPRVSAAEAALALAADALLQLGETSPTRVDLDAALARAKDAGWLVFVPAQDRGAVPGLAVSLLHRVADALESAPTGPGRGARLNRRKAAGQDIGTARDLTDAAGPAGPAGAEDRARAEDRWVMERLTSLAEQGHWVGGHLEWFTPQQLRGIGPRRR